MIFIDQIYMVRSTQTFPRLISVPEPTEAIYGTSVSFKGLHRVRAAGDKMKQSMNRVCLRCIF